MNRSLALREHSTVPLEPVKGGLAFFCGAAGESDGKRLELRREELLRLDEDLQRDRELQETGAPLLRVGLREISSGDRVGFVQSSDVVIEVYPKYLFPGTRKVKKATGFF